MTRALLLTMTLLAPLAAQAQAQVPAPAPAPAAVPVVQTPSTPAQAQSQIVAATNQRIAGLQAQLKITPEQMGPWNAFTQVMRDNAQNSDALFAQRASSTASMSAVANMDSYAQITKAYADGNERLAAAFRTVYDVLTPQQRQEADTLFRQQPPASTRR